MIDLQRVCYVRLGTRDLEGATRFATDVLGLEVGEVAKNAIYFKSDEREHTLCYLEGDPREQAMAFEVSSRAALAAAAGELERTRARGPRRHARRRRGAQGARVHRLR
jgi:2,3-dihydroxy-p-cumate/2,3-dihydroxybenzoate 3,4-dioxygenase